MKKEERGVSAFEYGLLIALVAAVIVGAIAFINVEPPVKTNTPQEQTANK